MLCSLQLRGEDVEAQDSVGLGGSCGGYSSSSWMGPQNEWGGGAILFKRTPLPREIWRSFPVAWANLLLKVPREG